MLVLAVRKMPRHNSSYSSSAVVNRLVDVAGQLEIAPFRSLTPLIWLALSRTRVKMRYSYLCQYSYSGMRFKMRKQKSLTHSQMSHFTPTLTPSHLTTLTHIV